MRDESARFQALVEVMERLRAPNGCPWDREQSFDTLKPYLVEEAYEVLEAIESGSREHLREELGDLLFQIVFQSQLASEEGAFDVYDVVEGIRSKMVSRHPHVFADVQADTPEAVRGNWEQGKRDERRKKKADASVLDGVPGTLPALLQASRLTEKASRVGFDWPSIAGVKEKLLEELEELDEATSSEDAAAIEHELGDLLFTVVNLSRFLKVNPEDALRGANRRFKARFQHLEQSLHQDGLRPEETDLDELDRRWNVAKQALKEL